LTAGSVAVLTIYDICKVMDKTMIIGDIYLVEKLERKSGHYRGSNIGFRTGPWQFLCFRIKRKWPKATDVP